MNYKSGLNQEELEKKREKRVNATETKMYAQSPNITVGDELAERTVHIY